MKTSGWIGIGLLLIGSASPAQDAPRSPAEEGAITEVEVVDDALNRTEVQPTMSGVQRQAQQSGRIAQNLQQEAQQKLRRFTATISRQFSDTYGLEFVEADPVLRSQLGLAVGEGVVVVEVKPEGLADQAGVKQNDIIVKLNDKTITSVDQAKKIIAMVGNKAIEVMMVREGKSRRLSLVGPDHGFPDSTVSYWVGIPVSSVDATLRSHLPILPADSGLIATDVAANSPADKAGVKKNDILVKCDGKLLTTQEVLVEQIQKSNGKEVSLEILRAGKTITLLVVPEKRPSSPSIVVSDAQNLLNGMRQHGDLPSRDRFIYSVPFAIDPKLAINLNPNWKFDDIAKNPYRIDGSSEIFTNPALLRPHQSLSNPSIQYGPVENSVPQSLLQVEVKLNELFVKLEELRTSIAEMSKSQSEARETKKAQ